MTCITPLALTDEQLNDVLDGVAEPTVLAHLEACDFCRARWEAARGFDGRLRAGLHRYECPPVQVLGDYELDLLPPDKTKAVRVHVRECPRCQQELNRLRDYINELDVLSPDPPVVGRKPGSRHLNSNQPHILIATPLQDVAAYASRGSAAVERSPGGAPDSTIDLASQPLHEVKGITIFMEVREAPNGQSVLVGQLILEDFVDWADALVELRQGGVVKTVSAVDSTAGFRCRLTNHEAFDVTITSRKGTLLLLRDVQPKR